MKKIIDWFKKTTKYLAEDCKETFTLNFILELLKKPSFIGWSLISVIGLVYFFIYGDLLNVIFTVSVCGVFYFLFLKK